MTADDAVRWAGAHALPLFVGALTLLLFGTAALWWLLRRHVAPRVQAWLQPRWVFPLFMALGFGIVVAAGALFAEVAEELEADAALGRLDDVFTRALRAGTPPAALRVFAGLTRLGDAATLTALAIGVAALLLWRGRRALAVAWLAALAGNGVLTRTLKAVFERVRPVHDDGLVQAGGWSFPSGHASGAVVACGMLAYLLLRFGPRRGQLPVLLCAAALAFVIGCSRVFLQVHYASDVLAGFASGTAWLAACIASIEAARRRGRAAAGPAREGS